MSKGLKILLGVSIISIVFQIVATASHWLSFELSEEGWFELNRNEEIPSWFYAELWPLTLGPFYESLLLTTLTLGLLVYAIIKYKSYSKSKVSHMVLFMILAWVFWTVFKGIPIFHFDVRPLALYYMREDVGASGVIQPLINIRFSLIVLQLFLVFSIIRTKV